MAAALMQQLQEEMQAWTTTLPEDEQLLLSFVTRPPQPAILRRQGEQISVELFDGEYGVSPGQACVLYAGEGPGQRVLGGGFIARA